MNAVSAGIEKFLKDEEGVTAIEYGVLAALIIVVCVGMIGLVGNKLNVVFNNIAGHL